MDGGSGHLRQGCRMWPEPRQSLRASVSLACFVAVANLQNANQNYTLCTVSQSFSKCLYKILLINSFVLSFFVL